MGLFSQMKAAVGVGAASVAVALEKGDYHWSETIRGAVQLTGGEIEQRASEVTVNITETWTELERDFQGRQRQERKYRYYGQVFLATQVAIPPASTQEWSFELQVPVEGFLAHQWYVAARVSVPGAVDRHGQANFTLLPSFAVMGLAAAVRQVVPCALRSMSNQSTQVTIDLKPAPEYEKVLDGLMLIVHEGNGQVSGVLEINPQEKSFSDRLKALTKQDRVKHQIAFSAGPLQAATTGAGEIPRDVIEQLRALIQPYLS
jgi:sporulation-control protein spo0M